MRTLGAEANMMTILEKEGMNTNLRHRESEHMGGQGPLQVHQSIRDYFLLLPASLEFMPRSLLSSFDFSRIKDALGDGVKCS